MLFKTTDIARQYPGLRLELRLVLAELEKQIIAWKLDQPTMTDAARTAEQQRGIYGDDRFSYHLVNCGADLRVEDPVRALAWLEGYLWLVRGEWELLVHSVGLGQHLHVALKDKEARRKYEHPGLA